MLIPLWGNNAGTQRHRQRRLPHRLPGPGKSRSTEVVQLPAENVPTLVGPLFTTDPYGQFHSPYNAMGNDPVNQIDPDGGWSGKVWTAGMRRRYFQRLWKRHILGHDDIKDKNGKVVYSFVYRKDSPFYQELMEWKTGMKYELIGRRPPTKNNRVQPKWYIYEPVFPHNGDYGWGNERRDIYSEMVGQIHGYQGGGSLLGSIIDQKAIESEYMSALLTGNLEKIAEQTMQIEELLTQQPEPVLPEGIVEAGKLEFVQWMPEHSLSSYTPGYSGYIAGLQTGLDVVGMVPGIGEFADAINAAIYYSQGDYVNAGLSVAAMVPFAGMAATGGKLVRKGLKFTDNQSALIDLAKDAKKRGGITIEESKILKEWSKEYNVKFRGPEVHPKRKFNIPHIHLGPVDHIPIK